MTAPLPPSPKVAPMSAMPALSSFDAPAFHTPSSRAPLTGRQKAAIIARLLLTEGAPVPLRDLPDDHQIAITEEMGRMRLVDRQTMLSVVDEFTAQIESVGVTFAGGMEGALKMVDGHVSDQALTRLRRTSGVKDERDPWQVITGLDPDLLIPVLQEESPEVCAILLSKLPVARAANMLGRLQGDRARRIAYAVSQTGAVAPQAVERVGRALVAQFDARPATAFATPPVSRVGAILNATPGALRDELLRGLEENDQGFADEVRKVIFTFAHIASRISPRDVARVTRGVDQSVLVTALAGAGPREADSAEFILSNMSQRLANTLRDEMAGLGRVREKDAEAAMGAVVAAIRDMEEAGEITFVIPDEDE